MLTIRASQIAAMDRAIGEQFMIAACAFVRREIPKMAATMPPASFDDLVRAAIRNARSLGFSDPWDQWRFALFGTAFGPEFYKTESWAADAFGKEGLSPSARLDSVEFYWRNYLAEYFQ